MSTPWVATRADLRLAGIAPSACVPDALQLASVMAPGIFELVGHGFEGGEPVRFAAGNGSILDSALSTMTFYPVIAPSDPHFFRVSFAGSPLVIRGDGAGLPDIMENFDPKLDIIMLRWTSYVIASATGYAGPWYTPPDWAPLIVAQLAAPTVAKVLRISTSRYDVKEIADGFKSAMEFVVDVLRPGGRMDDGKGPIDATDGTADAAMRARSMRPVGWYAPCRRSL